METGRAQFDLSALLLQPAQTAVSLARLEYAADLFDAATAERLLVHWRTLLAGHRGRSRARRLSELPLLAEAERQELLAAGNDTAAEIPGLCVHQLFEATAARSGPAPWPSPSRVRASPTAS